MARWLKSLQTPAKKDLKLPTWQLIAVFVISILSFFGVTTFKDYRDLPYLRSMCAYGQTADDVLRCVELYGDFMPSKSESIFLEKK